MSTNRNSLSLFAAAALAGCAAPPSAPPDPLAGTRWELVAIQSMDDAQGTTRIEQPERYTLLFGADGQLSLRLDCNRGSGRWVHTPAAAGAASGSLQIGPVASTRALCPPPSLDTRVARDLGYVRSYRLKNGRLYLSLMADGGIYEWRPAAR
jgi:heat shock protein HslJ